MYKFYLKIVRGISEQIVINKANKQLNKANKQLILVGIMLCDNCKSAFSICPDCEDQKSAFIGGSLSDLENLVKLNNTPRKTIYDVFGKTFVVHKVTSSNRANFIILIINGNLCAMVANKRSSFHYDWLRVNYENKGIFTIKHKVYSRTISININNETIRISNKKHS